MFQTAIGVTIPFPERVGEGYRITDGAVRASVSFEKLDAVIREFISLIEEPMFLALHIPLPEGATEEMSVYGEGTGSVYEQVMYLDQCSKEQMLYVYNTFGGIFLADGVSQFAIASHKSGDEMFVQLFKIVDFLGEGRLRYTALLEKHGIYPSDGLLTAWDVLDKEHPGKCRLVKVLGTTIYDAVERLKEFGLYAAGVIER